MQDIKNIFFALLFFSSFGCKTTDKPSPKFQDGSSANYLRIRLRIPIIDSNMTKCESYDRDERWESKKQIPDEGEIIHSWKNIWPYNEKDSTIEEQDGFRVKVNDSVGQQININSKIRLDSTVIRSGEFFTYRLHQPNNDRLATFRNLSEKEIDSILKSWKLYYLVLND